MPGRELDTYGNDGWELCGMVGTTVPSQSMSNTWPNLIAYTFKRLKPNTKLRDAAPNLQHALPCPNLLNLPPVPREPRYLQRLVRRLVRWFVPWICFAVRAGPGWGCIKPDSL